MRGGQDYSGGRCKRHAVPALYQLSGVCLLYSAILVIQIAYVEPGHYYIVATAGSEHSP
jgi:hypothetical protein